MNEVSNPNLKLATICLLAKDDVAANLRQALQAIDKAAELGADWVLLPEVWSYQGAYQGLLLAADEPRGAIYQQLAEKAAKHHICLFAGSYAEKADADEADLLNQKGQVRVHNVSYVFDRTGKERAFYRKTHLFNLYDEHGAARYCESDGYIPGNNLQVFDLEGWRVGLSICYDLRFPGLYQAMNRLGKEMDIITVPAAFTLETGKDHWELLLRARAVELQSYVFAANQFGENQPGKRCYGHSMIIDPWGDKLADTGDYAGIALAQVSKQTIQRIRSKLPALQNQRQELY
ncbi:MAG: carbon-nitrogen hydrolase family protein [Oligoflexus sp.]